MERQRLLNNVERYRGCLSKISKMFEAEIALLDSAGRCLFRSSNDKDPGLTSKIFHKVLDDVRVSGSTVVEKRNDSFRIIGVPLRSSSQISGVIVAGYQKVDKKQRPPVELQDILRDISRLMEGDISLQMEIDSLALELSTRYEELNLIYGVGDKLKVAEDLPGTIQYVIRETSHILHGNAIILSVPDKGIFEHVSIDGGYSDDRVFHIVDKIRERCDTEKTYVVVNSLNEFHSNGFEGKGWFKFIATPVKVKDDYKGILTVLKDSRKKDYTTGDAKLLSVLAEQLSIIITTNELYQNLKDFVLNLVKSMVSAIEAKDSYTRGHSERVNKISLMIARAMGLSERDIENISWASILHDVGKIGVPETILTKPERLTAEEYAIIKTHPQKGYEILKPIPQLKDALQGILYHQERYDGSGYPRGLKGEEIPLYARVIAVADTYDSITSRRAYRDHNSHINAMKEIERVSGSQLDPRVVEVFKKLCGDHPDFIRGE